MRHARTLPGWLSPRERVALAVVAKREGWLPGSMGGGYQKLDLMGDIATLRLVRRALEALGGPLVFHAALHRYPIGSTLPAHVGEPAPGRCQVQLHALVVGSGGGLFYLGGEEVPLDDGDAALFRPELLKHQLTAVEGNARLVFSVGAELEPEQARRIELA